MEVIIPNKAFLVDGAAVLSLDDLLWTWEQNASQERSVSRSLSLNLTLSRRSLFFFTVDSLVNAVYHARFRLLVLSLGSDGVDVHACASTLRALLRE